MGAGQSHPRGLDGSQREPDVPFWEVFNSPSSQTVEWASSNRECRLIHASVNARRMIPKGTTGFYRKGLMRSMLRKIFPKA